MISFGDYCAAFTFTLKSGKVLCFNFESLSNIMRTRAGGLLKPKLASFKLDHDVEVLNVNGDTSNAHVYDFVLDKWENATAINSLGFHTRKYIPQPKQE